VPVGKLVKVGVWENKKFIGCVLFGRGANKNMPKPYGLGQDECVELVRVALTKHETPVSKIMMWAIKFLKKSNPGIHLVVSYADLDSNHHGGIYQAGNWTYTGTTKPTFEYRMNGLRLNKRAYTGRQFGTGAKAILPESAYKVQVPGKHRYLYALEETMRTTLEQLRVSYPVNQRARKTLQLRQGRMSG
jgi:hypothetical protein